MRRQTQLADLIAGSGLVSGLARRTSSQDGSNTPAQPVLYHFGTGPGASKDHRDRPPLPAGPSGTPPAPSSASAAGRPPAAPAWPSPRASPSKSTPASHANSGNTTGSAGGSSSGGGALFHRTSTDTQLGSASSAPLPHLAHPRSNSAGSIDMYDTTSSVPYNPAAGCLPAVGHHLGGNPAEATAAGQPSQQLPQQFPLPAAGSHAAGGYSEAINSVASTRHSGGGAVQCSGASGSGAVQLPQYHPHMVSYQGGASAGVSMSGSEQPCYGSNHASLSGGAGGSSSGGSCSGGGGGGGSGGGSSAIDRGGFPPQAQPQHQSLHAAHATHDHGSRDGMGGSSSCSPSSNNRNLPAGSSPSPSSSSRRNSLSSGSGVRSGVGGGGGGFVNKRVRSLNASSGAPAGLHRSSSDSAVQTHGAATAALAVAAAHDAWVTAAAPIATPPAAYVTAPAQEGRATHGSGSAVSRAGSMPSTSGLGAAALAPVAGAAEMLVLEEADEQEGPLGGLAAQAGRAAQSHATPSMASTDSELGSGVQQGGAHGLPAGVSGEGEADRVSASQLLPRGAVTGAPPPPAAWPPMSSAPGTAATGVVGTAAAAATGAHPNAAGAACSLAAGPPGEVAELRRLVSELSAQVSRLTAQLYDSEAAAAQLQSLAATAEAAGREAAEAEAARKHMKALKSAEAARDKAEVSRRAAEKRARAAEEELAGLREKLEAKTKQASDLESSLAGEQAAQERQRRAHEEALSGLEAQHRAQSRKLSQDHEAEKKSMQETLSKMREDMARRNQTILALQADLEAAQEEGGRREQQLAGLRDTVAQLEAELERVRGSRKAGGAEAEGEQGAEAEGVRRLESRGEGTSTAPTEALADGSSLAAMSSASTAAASNTTSTTTTTNSSAASGGSTGTAGTSGSDNPGGRRSPAPSTSSSTAAAGAPLLDEQTRAVRKLQSEVAGIREQHAQRLVQLEEVVAGCEASMREGLQGMERVFGVLVSRTAALLAGRLGANTAAGKAANAPAFVTAAADAPTGHSSGDRGGDGSSSPCRQRRRGAFFRGDGGCDNGFLPATPNQPPGCFRRLCSRRRRPRQCGP
ncbi:hypothetical protein Agub_g4333 [Astrephomene gubernaculifera]|uniref:Uncharacterized protein n=1 Tax=Astrephomene gubernaculifera TaxID=47775 RepID=A0AAD3DK10_9CHLO|nr:hypothetical protein Agub_g4333 [Astrephomene gubernaculifera]